MRVAAQHGERLRNPVGHFLQAQVDPDDTRRSDEHFLGAASELTRDELNRRAGDFHAGIAGTRIRTTAVADNRPCASLRLLEVVAGHDDRRGNRLVRREHGSRADWTLGSHEHDVERPGVSRPV